MHGPLPTAWYASSQYGVTGGLNTNWLLNVWPRCIGSRLTTAHHLLPTIGRITMLIDDIDFADCTANSYFRRRTEKTNTGTTRESQLLKNGRKINCASLTDNYLLQLLSKIDLKGAESLFDMGGLNGCVQNSAWRHAAVVPGRWACHVKGCSRAGSALGRLAQCDIAVASRSTPICVSWVRPN